MAEPTITTEQLSAFLRRGKALALALEASHQAGNVFATAHTVALCPDAILVNSEGEISFRAIAFNDSVLSGSRLRYVSPEQAGRLGKLDRRSDLYSAGIILYEWLLGHPPFQSDDPLDLTHRHMAEEPCPPIALAPGVPKVLSDLVLKLLAKSPDARYATARGVHDDLNICLDRLDETGRIEPFELGHTDRGSQFLIPERLYGREAELRSLAEIYRRAVAGEIVLCMVGGYSGVGKSALVRAMRSDITASGGRLVEGKFDQYRRETPYSALIEAFRSLLRQVFSGRQAEVDLWRERVNAALGENASVVIEVLPELERLIGPQPPAPVLVGFAAQQRFNAVFAQLLRRFASTEHPLVMFLDDLQWADDASLALIQTFVLGGQGAHLLMVGAYRDNEVDAAHPMTQMLGTLRKNNALIVELLLGPLRQEHVVQLIRDTCYNIAEPDALAALVMKKAEGNPFYTRQFLKNMVGEGQLYFDRQADGWRWRAEEARLSDAAENVVDLMMRRLRGFPVATQAALKVGACIGKRFDLALLAAVCDGDESAALTWLAPALQEELLLPVGGAGTREFQFVHDRVQQAAYSMEGPTDRDALHLKIGRQIWRDTPPGDLDRRVFDIVDQINHSSALLDDNDERRAVAELNLRAGIRGKGSMAYQAAVRYLQAGIDLLGADAWTACYALSYSLHLHAAEAHSMLNQEEPFHRTVSVLLANVGSVDDRLPVRIRQTIHLCQSSRLIEGLTVGRQGLSEAGIDIPPLDDQVGIDNAFRRELEVFRERTAGCRLAERLYDLPMASDALTENLLRLIGAMGDAATITNVPLLNLMAVVGANRSLHYGNTVLSPLAYTLLGQGLVSHFKSYREARELAEVAIRLSDEKLIDFWSYGRSRVHQFWFVLHWSRHIETSLPQIEEAFSVTRRAHDPLYGAYLLALVTITRYNLGRNMGEVLSAHQRIVEHCRPYPMEVVVAFSQGFAGAATALRGETAGPTEITGAHVDEAA